MDVDDNCIKLWFLHSSSTVGGYNSNDWHADDPKTCAYVWTVVIGYNAMKKELN